MTQHTLVRRELVSIGALVALGMLAGCASGATPQGTAPAATEGLEQMDPITLKVALPFPDTSTPGRALVAYTDSVREASDGKIDFDIYLNGTLVPAQESLPAIKNGLTDIGFYADGYNPDELAVSAWTDQSAPTVVDWGYPISTVSQSAQTNFWDTNEAILAEQAANNMVPLFHLSGGPYMMLCSEEVGTPAQAEGKTIRVGGEPWVGEVEALGMVPTLIPVSDTYEALQRGVIACAYTEPSSILSGSFLEVANNLSLTNGGFSFSAGFAISKSVWDELPLAARQILHDAKAAALLEFARASIEVWAKLPEEVKAHDGKIVDSTAIDAVFEENREEVARNLLDSAPASLGDPAAHVEEFEAAMAEWKQRLDDEVGLEPLDASEVDDIGAAISERAKDIDWDALEQMIVEMMAANRPTE